MNHYFIWFDLRRPSEDVAVAAAIGAFLQALQDQGAVQDWNLSRRKLGFGPPELGEFHLDIRTRDLAQLDAAFGAVVPRSGDLEDAHAAVWSKVTNFRAGLWRDFPDPERAAPASSD